MRRAQLAALLLAAACGKSKQEQVHDHVRAVCESLHSSGATVLDAANEFSGAYALVRDCGLTNPDPSDPALAACDPVALLCRRIFWWYATDASLCGPFGCWFACEVWSPEAPAEPLVSEQPVCGAQFFDRTCPAGVAC